MLVLGLIQNLALLVALSVAQVLILRQWKRRTIGYRVLSGLLYGSVAIVAMMLAVPVSPGIVFDGRSIILGVAGFFGGPTVGLIAAAIAGSYRLSLGGAGTAMGVSVIVMSTAIGIGVHFLRRRYPQVTSIVGLWLFAMLVHLVMVGLTVMLPASVAREVLNQIAAPVLVGYPVAMVIISRLMLDQEEHLEANRALREAATRLRAIIEQTEQGITMVAPDGSFSIYNDAMVRLTGYTREDVEEYGWFELVYPSDTLRAQAVQLAREALIGQLPYIEMPITRKDGTERWVSFASTPITLSGETHSLSIITDVTEQRHAEQRMRELDAIVSRSPAVAFTWSADRGWPILFVSRSIEQFGYDADELMAAQTCLADLMVLEDVERISSETAMHLDEDREQFDLEYRIRVPGKGERWVAEHTWVVRDENGEVDFFQGVLMDIHPRKIAELELDRHRHHLEELVEVRTHELTRVNRELERASAAKGQLLANMSHELRTPMNSIIGFSAVLSQGMSGPLSEEQRHQTEMIHTSGVHLLSLINDMLDLSRLEAGRVELQIESCNPGEIMRETASLIEPMVTEKSLALELDVETGLPDIETDPSKVRQILLNLTGNAVKFTDEGRVILKVARRSGEADTHLIDFSVIDTGPGIAARDLDHIFEAFGQIEHPGRVKPPGTGLGLTICNEYARLLGGEVHVESRVGVGSTFTLTLPTSLGDPS